MGPDGPWSELSATTEFPIPYLIVIHKSDLQITKRKYFYATCDLVKLPARSSRKDSLFSTLPRRFLVNLQYLSSALSEKSQSVQIVLIVESEDGTRIEEFDECSAKTGNQSALERLARHHTPGPAASMDQERVGACGIGIWSAAVRGDRCGAGGHRIRSVLRSLECRLHSKRYR